MAITTKHKYINTYPIKDTDKYLILGTIHPHRTEDFEIDFFYGNESSLWKILSDTYSITLDTPEQILEFLNTHKIGVSDMILECDRADEKVTQDSQLSNLKLNTQLKKQILESNISTIFFTSSFNKNNAAKLFFDTFNLNTKIPKDWRDTYEFNIQLDQKTIKCIILLSPSGAANRSIPRTEIYKRNANKYPKKKGYVKVFKVDFYKDKFFTTINS